jgi:hypothetical protein
MLDRSGTRSDKFPGYAAAGVAGYAHDGIIEGCVRGALIDARLLSEL